MTAPRPLPYANRPAPYPRFHRQRSGKILGGVCAGLAEHFGASVLVVRFIAAVLCLVPPAAFGLYAGIWALTDARGTKSPGPASHRWLLVLAALLALGSLGFSQILGIGAVALTAAIAGAILVWRTMRTDPQPDQSPVASTSAAIQPSDRRAPTGMQWASLLGGTVLVIGGIMALFWQTLLGDAGTDINVLVFAIIAAVTLIVGFGVLMVPLWLRLWRVAADNLEERAAEAERERISSRIHDSVLQTLTLIQKNSSEPTIVSAARSQERQLRQWLFGEGESVRTSTVLGALRVACGEVEDSYQVQIRPVLVGQDLETTEDLTAMVLAAREAMVNAAKHSGCDEVNVYAELGSEKLEIFVRDRGPGFDVSDIPTDRQGVRRSMIGRVEKAGGTVEIDSRPGSTLGTEVIFTLRHAPSAKN